MKTKICVIISLLLSVSIVVIVNNNIDVIATPGSGGDGEDNSIGLDLDFIWNITIDVANVIHNPQVYQNGTIHKGREFGTKGDNYTAEYILKPAMIDIGLENVTKVPIQNISSKPNWLYNYKVDTISYNLTINGTGYPFPHTIPLNETYARPSGSRNLILPIGNFSKINYNNSFTNLKVVPKDLRQTLVYDADYYTTTYDNLTEYTEIIGNATYVQTDPPEDQEGRVFLIDEDEDVNEKLENITSNASAVILIHDNDIGSCYANTSKCIVSISRVYSNESSNITTIVNLSKNGTIIIADNLENIETFKFSYNPSFPDWSWCENDFFYVSPHNETGIYGLSPENFIKIIIRDFWESLTLGPVCRGIIAYDVFNETHLMWPPVRYWIGWGADEPLINQTLWRFTAVPYLQMFCVNYSVGKWLEENHSIASITGHLQQAEEWADAYNVIGNITIEQSPGDAITVINNRYDALESEAPGDSGAGAGIVLGIAKYFKDYNITPKYNLTFLMTTGEEFGCRGAFYYSHTHPEDEFNITQWIGFDQLGFNQTDSFLNPLLSPYDSLELIISFIANETEYEKRTNYGYKSNDTEEKGSCSTDDYAIRQRENKPTVITIHKDANPWPGHHRTGMNFQEGDSMKYIDRNDTNVTFEFAWNVTKYFTVDPDCWFENLTITPYDSPDDEDNLTDSYNISYTVKTIMPNDRVMVNASLINLENETVVNYKINYTINTSGIQDNITLTVPDGEEADFYNCTIDLYNSTRRINEILGSNPQGKTNNYYSSDYSYLYPINSNEIIPNYNSVSSAYSVSGVGCSSNTLSGNVISEVSGIEQAQVYVLSPDGYTFINYPMEYEYGYLYEYDFGNAWQNGQYQYCIWAEDINGNTSISDWHTFNVSAMADVSVCTVEDTYTSDEIVNLTDPPGPSQTIGYELLDDNQVLRIWNSFDSYYFNTSNGVQFSNHKDNYWSHNVLMLEYYNNNEWNLIYRTDELSGFNKNIESDSETYVNATLWKDLTYQGYNFRLAIRYYLGVDDNELTIIPYIKNLGQEIPNTLGFGWELKDIKIDNTPEGDYIEINDSSYYLNTNVDETYTDLTNPCYYIREDKTDNTSESLHLRWDENLTYKVQVKSRDGQYNAPVTLGINIGTLDVNQEKYTSLFWYDASTVNLLPNAEGSVQQWSAYPGDFPIHWNKVDDPVGVPDDDSTYVYTNSVNKTEDFNHDTSDYLTNATICNVRVTARMKYTGIAASGSVNIGLKINGTRHSASTNETLTSSYVNYSKDWPYNPAGSSACTPWTKADIDNLQSSLLTKSLSGINTKVNCTQIYLTITYNNLPVISNPYPADNSTGVPLTPLLNITVNDPDGDSMSISWLSNCSGSWQVFGTNNSIGNGTYHQIFSNATVNGQWWYWRVNVSDGNSSIMSSVFKFYTGNQSMSDNTGSYPITGYLLMQVQYYNTSLEEWVLADDTVNETSTRTVNVSDQLGLDTIFNGIVSTNDLLSGFGSGMYRVYACFRDPYGNVLECDDDGLMEATYEFTLS